MEDNVDGLWRQLGLELFSDVSVSCDGSSIWALGNEKRFGGYPIYTFAWGVWKKMPESLTKIAAISQNEIWGIKDTGEVVSIYEG